MKLIKKTIKKEETFKSYNKYLQVYKLSLKMLKKCNNTVKQYIRGKKLVPN